MITPVGALDHEVGSGERADRDTYDRLGYTVGRGVFDPDLVRQVRAPLIEGLIEDGHIEAVEGERDRFAWRGDDSAFDIHLGKYRSALMDGCNDLIVASGLASEAIEAMWGRRPSIWAMKRVFVMMPDAPDYVHRDGWHMIGGGGPEEHLNVWLPLTRVDTGDGPLAIAVGTHKIPDRPAEVPVTHPMHREVLFNTGTMPSREILAPRWRTTSFGLGDALVFRPDSVHSGTGNAGPFLRIAIGLLAQDARCPLSPKAGLSADPRRDLATVEWLSLAVAAVQPSTPWLARQAFLPRGVIGRLWPQQIDEMVTRAFAVLELRGLIEPHEVQPGEGTGIHRYCHVTPRGRADVREWLAEPADDPGLLSVKLLFCEWLDVDGTPLLTTR